MDAAKEKELLSQSLSVYEKRGQNGGAVLFRVNYGISRPRPSLLTIFVNCLLTKGRTVEISGIKRKRP